MILKQKKKKFFFEKKIFFAFKFFGIFFDFAQNAVFGPKTVKMTCFWPKNGIFWQNRKKFQKF